MARAIATSCWCPPDSWPGPLLGPIGQADAVERRPDPLGPLLLRGAAQRERILDVLLHRHVANEVEALEDQADLDVAHPGALGVRQLVDRRVHSASTPGGR